MIVLLNYNNHYLYNKKGLIIKISVIIPTYNREFSIERAINSVYIQSYKVDEIIVIDNNSTDDT